VLAKSHFYIVVSTAGETTIRCFRIYINIDWSEGNLLDGDLFSTDNSGYFGFWLLNWPILRSPFRAYSPRLRIILWVSDHSVGSGRFNIFKSKGSLHTILGALVDVGLDLPRLVDSFCLLHSSVCRRLWRIPAACACLKVDISSNILGKSKLIISTLRLNPELLYVRAALLAALAAPTGSGDYLSDDILIAIRVDEHISWPPRRVLSVRFLIVFIWS